MVVIQHFASSRPNGSELDRVRSLIPRRHEVKPGVARIVGYGSTFCLSKALVGSKLSQTMMLNN